MAVVDFNLKRETAGDLIVELHAVNGADHHHHGLAAVPVPPEKTVAILHADRIFNGVGTRGANGKFAIKCTQSLTEEGCGSWR